MTAQAQPAGDDRAAKAAAAIAATKKTAKKKVSKKTTKKAKTTTTTTISKGSVSAKRATSAKTADMTIKAISKMTKKDGEQKPLGFRSEPFAVAPSGSVALNNLIGGNPAPDKSGPICPGYPRQHITEIYGPESSGKTTLALEAIAEVQAQGGIAMFLDFENALHHGYAKALGVSFDSDQMALYQPDNMEQGLDMAAIGIKAGFDIIVIDSVAAMVTKDEMAKNFADVAKIGTRAAKLSEALPKLVKFLKQPPASNPDGTALIFINQTRAQIGGMSKGDGTAGGKALKFYAYLRLQANKIQSEYLEKVNPVTKKKERIPFGNKTKVKVVKSKVDAKQGSTAEIFIRYGQGLDDYYTTIESAVAHGIVKKAGAYFEYGNTRLQGREKFRGWLRSSDDTFKKLQDELLDAIRSQLTMSDDDGTTDEDEDIDALLTAVQGDEDAVDSSEDLGDVVVDADGED